MSFRISIPLVAIVLTANVSIASGQIEVDDADVPDDEDVPLASEPYWHKIGSGHFLSLTFITEDEEKDKSLNGL